jgi:hypothetical protein
MVIARGSIYLFAVAALSAFAQTTCAQLTSLKLPGTTITLAESVDAGPFRSPAAPAAAPVLPAYCRVAATRNPLRIPTSKWRFGCQPALRGTEYSRRSAAVDGLASSVILPWLPP